MATMFASALAASGVANHNRTMRNAFWLWQFYFTTRRRGAAGVA
jgi:hypothetical protein